MCGIIGYSGYRPAVSLLVEGLHRLEYRGYDSSGVAFEQAGRIYVVKAEGKLAALEARLKNISPSSGHVRHRSHALGHARPARGEECSSASFAGWRHCHHP